MSVGSFLRRLGRAIGDASLTIGIARGTTHGPASMTHADHLLARAALLDEGAEGYDARSTRAGLLDRVPGWLILLVFGIVGVAIIVLTSGQ